MRDLKFKHFAIAFAFLLLACQDTELESTPDVDQDMVEALSLANDFLSTSRNEGTDSDVTVLKYKSDLVYKTNTVKGGYDAISEQTITAVSQRGGYVFWHAGGGVRKLLGIEMDEDSQKELGDSEPFEVIKDHYWALWIPTGIDDDVETLKYDIIYETKSGEIVRLDPKIQIKAQH